MTNEEIYDFIKTVVDESEYDGTWNVAEFNTISKIITPKYFKSKVEELYRGVPMSDVLYSSKFLRTFVETEDVTPTTGDIDIGSGGDLSNDFAYWGYMRTTASYGTNIKNIELVSFDEYRKRMTDMSAPPVTKNPIALIYGDTLSIKPTNVGEVEFCYIRFPATPIYDYYIDDDKNRVYLSAGDSHTLSGNEVGSAGQVAPTLVNSLTVEPEFTDDYIKDYINFLLAELGVSGEQPNVYQHAQIEQQKDMAV
jgi:hypothetical protein